ncbi:hypothetical protein [Nannocystis pusilla]|uniref:hypothetical protein n=1 Tax=Nannocystis pusilla TaxID=889268 RepID=UPI003BF41AEF
MTLRRVHDVVVGETGWQVSPQVRFTRGNNQNNGPLLLLAPETQRLDDLLVRKSSTLTLS